MELSVSTNYVVNVKRLLIVYQHPIRGEVTYLQRDQLTAIVITFNTTSNQIPSQRIAGSSLSKQNRIFRIACIFDKQLARETIFQVVGTRKNYFWIWKSRKFLFLWKYADMPGRNQQRSQTEEQRMDWIENRMDCLSLLERERIFSAVIKCSHDRITHPFQLNRARIRSIDIRTERGQFDRVIYYLTLRKLNSVETHITEQSYWKRQFVGGPISVINCRRE